MRIALLLLLILFAGRAFGKGYSVPFDHRTEFPPYFVEGSPQAAREARKAVEEILKIRFERMTLPVPTDKPGEYKRVPFIEWATAEAKQLGLADKIRFHPSAGLIRNNIAEIYERIHIAKQRDPGLSVASILKQIKDSTPAEVFHTQVRGVGSDFDMLISGLTEKEREQLNSRLESSITLFEKKAGLDSRRSSARQTLKKEFILVPDLKSLDEQIVRASGQGGLESDFLFFDLKAGRLSDPSQLPARTVSENAFVSNYAGAVDRLLAGNPRYHKPQSSKFGAATDAQTVRALRTESEAVWTKIDDVDGAFKSELEMALYSKELSNKAKEQLEKMLRNSRFGGGANRYSRPTASETEVDKLIRKIVEKFPKSFRTFVAQSTPEELDEKLKKAPESLRAALMPQSEIPKALYHGIPSTKLLPAVARNGLIASREDGKDSTRAFFGDGAYASHEVKTAQGYASHQGVVIPLQVKADAKAIDWDKVSYTDREVLEAEAKARGLPLNLYLHDQCGISLVKDLHFMILDMAAIENPVKQYSDILRFYVESLARTPKESRFFGDVYAAQQTARYAELSGEPGVDQILSRAGIKGGEWDRLLADSFGSHPAEDIKALANLDFDSLSSSLKNRILQKMHAPGFRNAITAELWSGAKPPSEFLSEIFENLNDPLRLSELSTAEKRLKAGISKVVSESLSEGSKLRTAIVRDPATYGRLIDGHRMPPEIKATVQEKFSEALKTKGFEQRVLAHAKEGVSRGWEISGMINALDRETAYRVLDQIEAPEKMLRSIFPSITAGPNLTNVGSYLLDKKPADIIRHLGRNGFALRELGNAAIDRFHAAGLPTNDMFSWGVSVVEKGRLTDRGRWALEKDPAYVIKTMNDSFYYLSSLNQADVELLYKKGLPLETLQLARRSLIEQGELTPYARWMLGMKADIPLSAYEIPNLKKGSDLKLLMEVGYPKSLIAGASEDVLREAGVKFKNQPDGSRVVTYPSGEVSTMKSALGQIFSADQQELEKVLLQMNWDPEKLADYSKRIRESGMEFLSANYLLGGLSSQNPEVRAFAVSVLKDAPNLRPYVLKGAIVLKRPDLIEQIPLDLNNTKDQELIAHLQKIRDIDTKKLVVESANELRKNGVAKPSARDIENLLKSKDLHINFQIAQAMEAIRYQVPNPCPTSFEKLAK